VFKDTFGGSFLDQKICRDCEHRYEQEESFLSLSLPVKSKTLEESLKEFVKGDWLEGDNAYFCEKCEEKVGGVCVCVWGRGACGGWVKREGGAVSYYLCCVSVCVCVCMCLCVYAKLCRGLCSNPPILPPSA